MIFFLTGTSSAGKSTILHKIQEKMTPKPSVLCADDFAEEVRKELFKPWYQKMKEEKRQNNDGFKEMWDKESNRRYYETLNSHSGVLIVDTPYRHAIEDIKKLKKNIQYKIIFLGASLTRLYDNIIRRSEKNITFRFPASVLNEVMEYFDQAPCTDRTLVFKKQEIDRYEEFLTMKKKAFRERDLRGMLDRFNEKYFAKGQKETCVAPKKGSKYDLFLSADDDETADKIMKYISKESTSAQNMTKKKRPSVGRKRSSRTVQYRKR